VRAARIGWSRRGLNGPRAQQLIHRPISDGTLQRQDCLRSKSARVNPPTLEMRSRGTSRYGRRPLVGYLIRALYPFGSALLARFRVLRLSHTASPLASISVHPSTAKLGALSTKCSSAPTSHPPHPDEPPVLVVCRGAILQPAALLVCLLGRQPERDHVTGACQLGIVFQWCVLKIVDYEMHPRRGLKNRAANSGQPTHRHQRTPYSSLILVVGIPDVRTLRMRVNAMCVTLYGLILRGSHRLHLLLFFGCLALHGYTAPGASAQ
jgi:hypothetical protein